MKIRNDVRLGFVLMLGDCLAINAGFLFSYWLRFNSGLIRVVYGVPHISLYLNILPVLTLILIFLMRSERLYSVKARLSIVDEFFLIVRAVTLAIFIFMAATFIYRQYSLSRGMLLISWGVLLAFISGWRFLVNRIRFILRKNRAKTRNLLLIGNGPMVSRLIKHVSGDPHWNYNVKGIVQINGSAAEEVEGPVPSEVEGVPVKGTLEDFTSVIETNEIEEVILTDLEVPRPKVINMVLECEKRMIEFRLVADLLGMITSQVDMRTIDGVPLLGLKETPLAEGYNRFLKRVLDVAISAVGLVLLSPVLMVTAVLVKLNSAGPVFYLQKRVGEDGIRFTMIKFRTMIKNAEKGLGPVWAKKNDPRRTRIGAFLRRFNLDEVPQLWNVLKGEMSLVGPRPERPRFVGQFRESVPRYMSRHKIKSGVTGWAQVNGLRGNTSIEERTKYDLYYIENWSLAFDIKILFMSLFALKNAY